MTKIHKSVLRSSIVMLSLLAAIVLSSGVAQAQKCIAQGMEMPPTVRAEGITETVGSIDVKCEYTEDGDLTFGTAPGTFKLSIALNTNITNPINDERVIAAAVDVDDATGLTYTPSDEGGLGGAVEGDFAANKLSADGNTIEWTLTKSDVGLTSMGNQFQTTISGIHANASRVNGGEITAVVSVDGTAVNSVPFKLADVMSGLEVKVDSAAGLQCDDESKTATITIKETFDASITDADGFLLLFRDIPEGVTVIVPLAIDAPMNMVDVAPMAAFGLDLDTMGRVSGVTAIEDDTDNYTVDRSPAGTGAVTYMVRDDTTSAMLDDEWANVVVTFEWEEGSVVDTGNVDVSFSPVSTVGGDTFSEPPSTLTPRFVATNNPVTIISVTSCETSLLFPYVTGLAGYSTGIAITNTSGQDGSCTAKFFGDDAPEDMESPEIAKERQWVFLTATEFQGYLTVDCNFKDGKGFAFVSNPWQSVAHGYLAQEE